LGILKAGGAYLPLDASYPAQRLAFMLEDAPPRLLLTSQALRSQLPVSEALPCLLWDELSLEGLPTSAPDSGVTSRNLAYVDFTSGSTGRPKGVAIEHRSVLRLLHGASYAHLSPEETFLLLAPISFDASTLEVWGPLVHGARLVVFPPQSPSDLDLLTQVLERHAVTTLHLTSGLFTQAVDHKLDSLRGLRQLLTGGDVVSAPHVRRVLEQLSIPVTACYGPTESTLFTSCFRMTRPEQPGDSVPIGTPIANTQVYLLDAHLRPVPVGVPGELYIGGDGLARGYLSRPDLTAERFLPNPFSSQPGERLYRTGDLARWRPDGVLSFLGRLDNQVKVRGYRIEPAEVEAALLSHPEVREAVALVREDVPGDKRLVAYVVPALSDVDSLRTFLAQRLPEFMRPSAFVALESLPLTSNAKVDRKALPAPDGSPHLRAHPYTAPATSTEEQLAALWTQVLRVPQVGRDDDFFSLGGHSLLATQVMARLSATFGVELPLRTLFEAPTLRSFAARLDAASESRGPAQRPPLVPAPRSGPLPLSFAQQRLWFLEQLEPNSPLYNLPAAIRLEGTLDLDALRHGFQELVRRHESLRTTFRSEAGQPLQVIAPSLSVPLEVVDLSGLPSEQREAELRRLAQEDAQRTFHLSTGPLLRTQLLRLSGSEHVLLLNMHHIISDAWSTGVLVREMAALYEAHLQGKPSALPELPVQYADYALWQRQWQSDVLERQLSYWTQQLAGMPQALELPTDKPRPPVQSFRGASVPVVLSKPLSEKLERLCEREGVTPFMALLATFQLLLSRYSHQDDIAVGSPIAGRRDAGLEGLIGFFVNTLVLRSRIDARVSFRSLLSQVRSTTLDAFEHQDLPFEKLVEAIQPQRDLSRSPLFQVMFALQNAPTSEMALPGLKLRPLDVESRVSKFDANLVFTSTEHGFHGVFEYATDLFEHSTAARMMGHFQVLLEAALSRPDASLSELPLLSESERQQVLVSWNQTWQDYPRDSCIHHLIQQQAALRPDAIAVEFGEQRLSWRELEERSNALAHLLRAHGVGPDALVALCLERSVELIVSLLGILKAGGAYLPLDASYPAQRLAFMLEDAPPRLLLTSRALRSQLPISESLPSLVWDELSLE
ncbi:non-ribosomal peptide synthetase, partial [Archangium violaceum]|uniref:non-ribosomal peptide synthetase n=1 Tax=Archangium violaceum TaxID=83451 RepID=UPI0005B99427